MTSNIRVVPNSEGNMTAHVAALENAVERAVSPPYAASEAASYERKATAWAAVQFAMGQSGAVLPSARHVQCAEMIAKVLDSIALNEVPAYTPDMSEAQAKTFDPSLSGNGLVAVHKELGDLRKLLVKMNKAPKGES